MKIYHGKGSCSLGILVLLEEAGIDYEVVPVDLPQGQQRTPEFLRTNPKAKVPVLELDSGEILTEWPAIAFYIAAQYADRLLPTDALRLARMVEVIDYMVATVHMQGFTRIVRPAAFAPEPTSHDAVVARGREIFEGGLRQLDERIVGPYVLGELTAADAAAFYVEHWKAARLGEPLPARCAAHYELMLSRPSVQRALLAAG